MRVKTPTLAHRGGLQRNVRKGDQSLDFLFASSGHILFPPSPWKQVVEGSFVPNVP